VMDQDAWARGLDDFADLPNPTTKSWGFLSKYGFIAVYGTTASLRELEALGGLPPTESMRRLSTISIEP